MHVRFPLSAYKRSTDFSKYFQFEIFRIQIPQFSIMFSCSQRTLDTSDAFYFPVKNDRIYQCVDLERLYLQPVIKNRDNLFVKRHKLELSGIDKFSFLRPIRSTDKAKIMIDKTCIADLKRFLKGNINVHGVFHLFPSKSFCHYNIVFKQ